MSRSFWPDGSQNLNNPSALLLFFRFGIVAVMKTKEKKSDSKGSSEVVSLPLVELFDGEKQALKNILDKISIGIIILNWQKRAVLFANEYFYAFTPQQKRGEILSTILDYINTNIHSQKKIDISQDIVVKAEGKEILLSYTTYRVDEENFIVLLTEVTSGIQYFLAKQENLYYSRLSELIAEMVHEIGNPLSGINTSLHILLQNVSSWPVEKVINYIERTIAEISRLSEFLKRMREVSDDYDLKIMPMDLKETLDRVLRQSEDLFSQKGITCKNMTEVGITVLIDEGAFHQIIFNLVNNSLHVLSPGKEIKIYVEEIDEFYVRLVYRNNGDPIPEELMEKIFSPLYTTRKKRKGIGLAISLKLMTRMGGTMKVVTPEDDFGVKFVLYVPNSCRDK